jgi:hypothetical protein
MHEDGMKNVEEGVKLLYRVRVASLVEKSKQIIYLLSDLICE